MIKNREMWERWEANYIASQPVDFEQNLRIVEALYEQARAVGAIPAADPMEGIETKVAIAKVLNVSNPPRKDSPRT